LCHNLNNSLELIYFSVQTPDRAGLTMIINTNANPENFEPALIRPGRLTPIEIGHPSFNARTQMWQYFSQKYGITSLSEEQARELSELTPEKSGASIANFCKGYILSWQRRRLNESGTSLFDALNNGTYNPDEVVSVSYDELRRNVVETFRPKTEDDDRSNGIGFHTLFPPKE
jgi:SpoVK/Ycf46/Vps4 family AAA+-type ATPase